MVMHVVMFFGMRVSVINSIRNASYDEEKNRNDNVFSRL